MATATCHTEGCGNADQPIDVELMWVDDDGIEHPAGGVSCGACGEPITDIADAPPEYAAAGRARSGDHDLSGKDDRG